MMTVSEARKAIQSGKQVSVEFTIECDAEGHPTKVGYAPIARKFALRTIAHLDDNAMTTGRLDPEGVWIVFDHIGIP